VEIKGQYQVKISKVCGFGKNWMMTWTSGGL